MKWQIACTFYKYVYFTHMLFRMLVTHCLFCIDILSMTNVVAFLFRKIMVLVPDDTKTFVLQEIEGFSGEILGKCEMQINKVSSSLHPQFWASERLLSLSKARISDCWSFSHFGQDKAKFLATHCKGHQKQSDEQREKKIEQLMSCELSFSYSFYIFCYL